MNEKLDSFVNSKFMQKLNELSGKLAGSTLFSSISEGMAGIIGVILIGAVIQVITALLNMTLGWEAGHPIYDIIYTPYKLTMGLVSLYLAFNLGFCYSRKCDMRGHTQHGFTALICFILVACPITSVTVGENTFDAFNLGDFGSVSIFVAMIVALGSVAISKFVIDHNWQIKMPKELPDAVAGSFNSIIPAFLNIVFWGALSVAVSKFSGGQYTLASLINYSLVKPIAYLTSPIGMIIAVSISHLLWFFGIHGSGIVFTAILAPTISAISQNAALFEQGQPLEFSATFLFLACSFVPLCVMGLKSKSKRISAISKAAVIPAFFGITEPVVFGFPTMYNTILLIPTILSSVVMVLLKWAGMSMGLLSMNRVFMMGCLPLGMVEFLSTFDWRTVVFTYLMLPVTYLIFYPFFKVYEKQCIEEELNESQEEE